MDNGNRKTRLELTWIRKENRPKLELPVALEDPAKGLHDGATSRQCVYSDHSLRSF